MPEVFNRLLMRSKLSNHKQYFFEYPAHCSSFKQCCEGEMNFT